MNCPYCGGTEFFEVTQNGLGAVYFQKDMLGRGIPLYHLICKKCGCVVKSYVKDIPEKLLEKYEKI